MKAPVSQSVSSPDRAAHPPLQRGQRAAGVRMGPSCSCATRRRSESGARDGRVRRGMAGGACGTGTAARRARRTARGIQLRSVQRRARLRGHRVERRAPPRPMKPRSRPASVADSRRPSASRRSRRRAAIGRRPKLAVGSGSAKRQPCTWAAALLTVFLVLRKTSFPPSAFHPPRVGGGELSAKR